MHGKETTTPLMADRSQTETSTSNLAGVLAELKNRLIAGAPPQRVAIHEAGIDALRNDGVLAPLGIGDCAPNFILLDAKGDRFELRSALSNGPIVLTFYRGGWCPFCNLQLRAYQAILPQIVQSGASLVAISPQTPDGSLSTAQNNDLAFTVLSDTGSVVGKNFGLVFSLSSELRNTYQAGGIDLARINGNDDWLLPVPATYVIDRGGRILFAHVEVDYRVRLDPECVLAALSTVKAHNRDGADVLPCA